MSSKIKIQTPEWVKDAVFYQIFPDRFASSPTVVKPANLELWDDPPTPRGFKGGDLMGIVEKLDYLQDLGITAIYLNPIFQSAANHRYHTYDYFRVDPLLGGDSALRALLDAAHARSIRIVLDGVFNHASRGFFQFNHILENGPASPYVDWFVIEKWPLHPYDEGQPANYRAWWSVRELPAFNTDLPAVREYLWGVAEHWIRFGADGWRLDVPEEIDDPPFWQEFRRRVRAANPEAYLVGEIWRPAQSWLQGDRFDAVMNYPFGRACLGFMGAEDLDTSFRPGGFELESLSAAAFARQIEENLGLYDWQVTQAQLNLLSSHDTPRFVTVVGGGAAAVERLKLATLFQMTFPGAPCVYYGDEIGLEGGNEPACRGAFPWDPARWNQALHAHVRRCIHLRHAHPALRRGSLTAVHAEDGVYAFVRELQGERLLVALNSNTSARRVPLSLKRYRPAGAALQDVWSGEAAEIRPDLVLALELAPLGGRVLRWLP